MPLDELPAERVADSVVAGCFHDKGAAVFNAYHAFFTNPPANRTQRVDVQLKAFVENSLGQSFTAAEIEQGMLYYLKRR